MPYAGGKWSLIKYFSIHFTHQMANEIVDFCYTPKKNTIAPTKNYPLLILFIFLVLFKKTASRCKLYVFVIKFLSFVYPFWCQFLKTPRLFFRRFLQFFYLFCLLFPGIVDKCVCGGCGVYNSTFSASMSTIVCFR